MSASTPASHHASVPPGSGALFFIQTFATLGFAVLYSTLVLYATKRLGFSESQANAMMGIFGAFNYGLHLFGGYLGGRYLSNRNLFVMGMVLQVIGCYLIAERGISGLYWGLAMFLTGSGLNVTCLNMMLTQRFAPDDHRRESAFLWNYAGMNLGFFIGFSVAGYFQLTEDYRTLFLFATLGNMLAIIATLCFWPILADINTPLRHIKGRGFYLRMLGGLAILALLVPALRLLLTHASFSGSFVLLLGAMVLVLLCVITACHRDPAERSRMVAYLILALGSLIFWSLYQLAPMGLMLFSEHNINLNVFGWQVAPQWIQNINTLVIVIGGPLMALLFKRLREQGWRIDIPSQFAASLFLHGAGDAGAAGGHPSGRGGRPGRLQVDRHQLCAAEPGGAAHLPHRLRHDRQIGPRQPAGADDGLLDDGDRRRLRAGGLCLRRHAAKQWQHPDRHQSGLRLGVQYAGLGFPRRWPDPVAAGAPSAPADRRQIYPVGDARHRLIALWLGHCSQSRRGQCAHA
ncbi:oligopeptide:H+ symporter [Aeromonas encheleia]|nr:oligopeptide:H+ symporter [Aeromonas encheleia]